jgi:excisionase family DNA binding protein
MLVTEIAPLQEGFPPKRIAKTLGLSTKTVRRLIRCGDLRAHRVGLRHWRIFQQDLQDYLARRANRSAA